MSGLEVQLLCAWKHHRSPTQRALYQGKLELLGVFAVCTDGLGGFIRNFSERSENSYLCTARTDFISVCCKSHRNKKIGARRTEV
jgi:hypothetical protein